MADNSVVKQFNRVVYIEPNDIYGSVNGVPLSPDYEDYCISFNLIVENVSRYNPKIVKATGTNTDDSDSDKSFVLTFGSNYGDTADTSNKWSSFMQGEEYGDRTFLTTYYTEISFDEVKKRTIVEGLGVESVNISFESYYTPTVVIKFVDVRGSALFGREEATHENGKITADNIFGCFFTMPYPKFKLQVKGFYGKPVTFQLTCSNFRGNFNPKNGNFEATATFIGYSYSLLTDIPLLYLIAAPYCNYEGRSYWSSRVNSTDWSLDGKPMVTLYELMNYIDSKIVEESDDNGINEDDSKRLSDINYEKTALNNIQTSMNEFIKAFTDDASAYVLKTGKSNDGNIENDTQLFLMYSTVEDKDKRTRKYSDTISKKHSALLTAITEYNLQYSDNSISNSKYPNGESSTYGSGSLTTYTVRYSFAIVPDNNGNIIGLAMVGASGKELEKIKEITFNDKIKLNDAVAEEVHKLITNRPYNSKSIQQYVYVVDLYDVQTIVANRLAKLTQEYDSIMNRINEQKSSKKVESLPIKPTIGNIFKIIMAHLETFIHIIGKSVLDINASDRTPGYLGVNINNTDAVDIKKIPPWVGIYTQGTTTQNGGEQSPEENILAWPGDINDRFVETKVVENIIMSVMRVETSEKDKTVNTENMALFPVLPCDLNSSNSPFNNTTQHDLSSMGGYLGIRIAQIFGVMFNNDISTELASLIGRMDAYNYYRAVGSYSVVNSEIFERVNSDSVANVFSNIMLCNTSADTYGETFPNTGKQRHKFENNIEIRSDYNNNQRCPIFYESGEKYNYARYYDESLISLVPSKMDEFDNYAKQFIYNRTSSSDIYFVPSFGDEDTVINADNFMHISTTMQLFSNSEEKAKLYMNDDLFNIVTDQSSVSQILSKYEQLDNGTVKMFEYEDTDDFSSLLDKVWYVKERIYCKYYTGVSKQATLKLAGLGIENNKLLPLESDGEYPLTLKDNSWLTLGDKNGIEYNGDGSLSIYQLTNNDDGSTSDSTNTVSFDDICIQQCSIMYNGFDNSLFGHSFYYMQNNRLNGESDSEYNDRVYKVKCLLYLHTLKYSINSTYFFLNSDRNNGTISAVPYGYLLFLGGLLWRRRYITEKGYDPIIYSEKTLKYKSPGNDYTLLRLDYVLNMWVVDDGDDTRKYNVSVNSRFGFEDNEEFTLEYYIENKLIRLFIDFCSGEFKKIVANCELVGKYGRTSTTDMKFTGTSFITWISRLNAAINESDIIANGMKSLRETVTNLFGNYRSVYVDKNNKKGISLLMNEDNSVQSVMKNVYYDKCIVLDSLKEKLNRNNTNNSKQITVSKSLADAYLNSFATQIKKIVDKNTSNEATSNGYTDKADIPTDMKTSMYYYIKNLYDRWLISAAYDEYNVEKFFKNNFVFIDKFYVNIYDKFIINCEKLSDLYHSRINNKDGSLYSFIGDIVGEHRCMFIALPDYVGFGSTDIKDNIDAMEDMFRPMSYEEMTEIRENNHFVTIYVGPTAHVAGGVTNYRYDGFDINSSESLPSAFKSEPLDYSDNEQSLYTRYGYNVPSFGISYGRQNQHIFKDVSVSMNNPMDTDISIRATCDVAKLGSGKEHKILYYGQDLYNIYSNYSYECEVEMMGDAQIQPLMYFQLLDIPMWSGAYMIFNVTHSMTPGNMVTKFKGMKMSKYNIPYCSEYYANMNYLDSIDTVSSRTNDTSYVSNSNVADITMPEKYATADGDDVVDYTERACGGNKPRFVIDGVELNPNLKTLFNQLVSEIKKLPENSEKETWTICISSAVRDNNRNSEHAYNSNKAIPANAIDVQILNVNSDGSTTYVKDAEKVFTVMDIIATNHLNFVGQVIFEGRLSSSGNDTIFNQGYKNNYTCLHISYTGNTLSSGATPQIYISSDGNGSNIAKNPKNVAFYSENVPPEYKAIAKKYYAVRTSGNDFRNKFRYYMQFSDDELKTHFGTVRTSNSDTTGYIKSNGGAPTKRNNPGSLAWIGYDEKKPGVVKTGSDQWDGTDMKGLSWSQRFAVFTSMLYGTRALFVNLNTLIVRDGKNTISTLISAWAPPSENKTKDYITNVAKAAGVNANTYKLTSLKANREVCIAIARQIAIQEDGIILTDETLEQAYSMACSSVKIG